MRIDDQHKHLIRTLNELITATEQNKGKEVIVKTVEFLAKYTVTHFTAEEKLQEIYGYPDYLRHKELHEKFKLKVEDFYKQLNKEGPTPELMKTIISTVGDWLVGHIKGEDIRMAAFIKSMGDTGV
jgi:hemerythrin